MYLQIPVHDKDLDFKGNYELALVIANVSVFSIWKAYKCVGIMLLGWGVELRWY